MWTENAPEAKLINTQVADVNNALLSLSRWANMGFESCFGQYAWALVDKNTGEVKAWIRAAPFGRPE